MDARLTTRGAFAGVWRTYRGWVPHLLLLALIVFIPLGLINSITVNADIEDFSRQSLAKVLGSGAILAVLGVSGLLGEVFYTGVVAAYLTHPDEGRAPALREVALTIRYGTLLVVDVIYGVLVAVGLVLFLVTGVLTFVWLGLAAPVVEIEGRGVRASMARSKELVRGRFWTVLSVLLPIALLGEGLAGAATRLADDALGDSLLSHWLAEVVTSVAFTPFFAVAAVLLTVTLIREKEGAGPRLHSAPVPR